MVQEEWKSREIEFLGDDNEEYAPDFEDNSPLIKNPKASINTKSEKNSYSIKGI